MTVQRHWEDRGPYHATTLGQRFELRVYQAEAVGGEVLWPWRVVDLGDEGPRVVGGGEGASQESAAMQAASDLLAITMAFEYAGRELFEELLGDGAEQYLGKVRIILSEEREHVEGEQAEGPAAALGATEEGADGGEAPEDGEGPEGRPER